MGGGKERRGTAEGTHVHTVIIPRAYELTYYRGKIEAMVLIPYSVVIRLFNQFQLASLFWKQGRTRLPSAHISIEVFGSGTSL